MWTVSFNPISLIMVETFVLSKLRSRGSNSNFRFLIFVTSGPRKSLDSVLGLNFLISAPMC